MKSIFLLFLEHLVSSLRNCCLIQGHENLCLCFFLSFTVLAFTFWSLIRFRINFCIRCEVRVQPHFSARDYPVVPEPFIGRVIVSPVECSGHPCRKSIHHKCKGSHCTLSYILLICMSILMAV